jgi:hypothetical protein
MDCYYYLSGTEPEVSTPPIGESYPLSTNVNHFHSPPILSTHFPEIHLIITNFLLA